MNKFHFGQNLKAIRLKKQVTQEQIAFRLNISQRSYSRIEGSPVIPNVRQVSEIARALDVPPIELVPNLEALAEQAMHNLKGYGRQNMVSGFLITPFGKFTYIIIGAMVTNALYRFTKGFCDGLEASRTTMFTVSAIVAMITVCLLYYAWRKITRLA
jgi:transcriptional regulator with XRE-family HTH domain